MSDPLKPTTAAVGSRSAEGSAADGAMSEKAEQAAESRRKSGSLGCASREPVRAELLDLQLNECASEMEEQLRLQVMNEYWPVGCEMSS